jgi:hypothetical protein
VGGKSSGARDKKNISYESGRVSPADSKICIASLHAQCGHQSTL